MAKGVTDPLPMRRLGAVEENSTERLRADRIVGKLQENLSL